MKASNSPRVVLFADTFHEINGAANVIRRLTDFAERNGKPFLCIRSGAETKFWTKGTLSVLELRRGRTALRVDGDLKYDPLLWRYKNLIGKTLDEFKPDIAHLTGLNDVSQLGFYWAHYKNLPAVASWHTNTHEYAASRLCHALESWLPAKLRDKLNEQVERGVMRGLMKLYFLAQIQLAPNEELVAQIQKMTRRPSYLMSRGVDTEFLKPEKRNRTDNLFTLGFVGRLQTEKNVRFLVDVEKMLIKSGIKNYKFLIVGDGGEESYLRQNLQNAEFTGVIRGESLAQAFANMDLFVFPSKTDAFGNVVLEAMAAGVPAIVMPEGGPKFLIEQNTNGYIASNDADFIGYVVRAAKEPEQTDRMRTYARFTACKRSWETVFERVYQAYNVAMTVKKNVRVNGLQ